MSKHRSSSPEQSANPFPAEGPVPAAMLAPWRGGVPPWHKVDPAAFPAAFERAMGAQRERIRRITGDSRAPSFANTIAALERSGRMLERVSTLFEVHASTLKVGDLPRIEAEVMPRLAAFADEIIQDPLLFQRIEAVHDRREGLDPEQRRLAWLLHTQFVRNGARLDGLGKARVQAINQRLAGLFTRFSQNVLDEEAHRFTVVEREADLAGLSGDFRGAAARAAEAKALAGRWVIENTRSAVEPFLAYAEHRGLREQVWRAFVKRGDNGGKSDNKALIPEILRLRLERARLLGYASHAHWSMEPTMAATPGAGPGPHGSRVAAGRGPGPGRGGRTPGHRRPGGRRLPHRPLGLPLLPGKAPARPSTTLDLNEVQPYLQLDRLREGMFWAAGRLYGLAFEPVRGLPLPHPDVSVWAVADAEGRPAGLWYFDPFARAGKSSGAWMSSYRAPREAGPPGGAHRVQQRQLRQGRPRRAGAHFLG
jgi:peptidyl-dipeptidase Dcp